MTALPPTYPAGYGRDPHGRFSVPPFAHRVAALRVAFQQSIQAEDIAALARMLVAKARRGDVAAARLLLSYLPGAR